MSTRSEAASAVVRERLEAWKSQEKYLNQLLTELREIKLRITLGEKSHCSRDNSWRAISLEEHYAKTAQSMRYRLEAMRKTRRAFWQVNKLLQIDRRYTR